MSQTFGHHHPDYVIKHVNGQKISPTRESVKIQFEAPNNIQDHGHASLLFDKQADGSWVLISEEILMGTK